MDNQTATTSTTTGKKTAADTSDTSTTSAAAGGATTRSNRNPHQQHELTFSTWELLYTKFISQLVDDLAISAAANDRRVEYAAAAAAASSTTTTTSASASSTMVATAKTNEDTPQQTANKRLNLSLEDETQQQQQQQQMNGRDNDGDDENCKGGNMITHSAGEASRNSNNNNPVGKDLSVEIKRRIKSFLPSFPDGVLLKCVDLVGRVEYSPEYLQNLKYVTFWASRDPRRLVVDDNGLVVLGRRHWCVLEHVRHPSFNVTFGILQVEIHGARRPSRIDNGRVQVYGKVRQIIPYRLYRNVFELTTLQDDLKDEFGKDFALTLQRTTRHMTCYSSVGAFVVIRYCGEDGVFHSMKTFRRSPWILNPDEDEHLDSDEYDWYLVDRTDKLNGSGETRRKCFLQQLTKEEVDKFDLNNRLPENRNAVRRRRVLPGHF
jgi:hypothetical protein